MSLCINPNCPQPNHPGNDATRFCQSCGAGLVLQERYRVMRLLSDRSGFGRVYEAYERNTPKLLKVLKERHNDNPKAVELFEQEALVLSHLRHPGIPMVEDDGCFQFKPHLDSEPLHCIIMEKIDGLNLSEWMRQQGGYPITERQAINWLRQLAEILHLVHQQNYFHRDIKPENIMLRSNGQLVLVDFGAAREMTYTYFAQLGATGGITRVSSAGYTPPEQERGQAVPQSDFYALGCTFIFLLTGKTPSNPSIYDSLNNEFRWRQFAPHISAQLADFIDCLIAAKASARPASTKDLMERIEAIAQALESQSGNNISHAASSNQSQGSETSHSSQHPLACPIPTPAETVAQPSKTRVQPNQRRHPRVWIASLAIAVVAVGGGATWLFSRQLPAPEAQLPGDVVPYALSGTLTGHTGKINALALSDDQQTLASGSDDTTVRLWNMVERQETFVLRGHQNPVNALAFSPNSRYVASGGDDLYIKIWDAVTGAELITLTGHEKSVNDLVFTADSATLISASADGTIKVWNWRSGEVVMTLNGHRGFVNAIALSPNGKTLASGAADNTIKIWDLETGEEKDELLGHTSFVNAIAISPDGQRLSSGSADSTIKIWNINTGTEIRTLDDHESYVNALLFSPDGRTLVSSSADQTIKAWTVSSGAIEASIPWPGTFIDAIAVKIEGPSWQMIAGGKGSQDIQIWQLTR